LSNTSASLCLSERLAGPAQAALKSASGRGFEGIVAKERSSLYQPRRSRAWLKLKAHLSQELAIVGFTPSSKGAGEIGALQLAVARPAHRSSRGLRAERRRRGTCARNRSRSPSARGGARPTGRRAGCR